MTTVAVVTPWLGHPELLDGYIDALALGPVETHDEVIVVDNGSSPPLSRGGYDAWLKPLRLEHNRGFTGGCNAGLEAATADAVLFLNNDVVATRSGWLAAIRAALEPGVLVGARLRTDRHGDVDGLSYPYLDGWCLGGMRADLLELGGFDEEYEEPAYYSDNDLCFRARAAGMRLREVRVPLLHLENVTAGRGDEPHVVWAREENRRRFELLVREEVAA